MWSPRWSEGRDTPLSADWQGASAAVTRVPAGRDQPLHRHGVRITGRYTVWPRASTQIA